MEKLREKKALNSRKSCIGTASETDQFIVAFCQIFVKISEYFTTHLRAKKVKRLHDYNLQKKIVGMSLKHSCISDKGQDQN